MINDVEIAIAGAAGQGMQSISFALGKTFSRAGFFVYIYHDLMSRIRGGSNASIIRVKSTAVSSISYSFDILVALDRKAILGNLKKLKEGGVVVYDGEKIKFEETESCFFSVPLERLALEAGKNKITVNSVATGAVLALLKWDVTACNNVIRGLFSGKGEEIITNNINAVKAGYDYVSASSGAMSFELKVPLVSRKRLFMTGSESLALASIASGVKFYAGYPMSPSTAVMEYIAAKANEYEIICEQAEDEIAAINMVIGASYGGVRAMTATSGGGFALMTEGISLSGMTETPVVVILSQRPGPATGFPTRTEQGDLKFALYSGHGEFAKIILAPRNAAESFLVMSRAFNLAEEYQVPVIVLTDQCFNDSSYTVNAADLEIEPVNRGNLNFIWPKDQYTYKKYSLSEPGFSPRLVPGCPNQVVCDDSDEHTEEGHISESDGLRNRMVEKRLNKLEKIAAEIKQPVYIGSNAPSILFLGWGSTCGAIKEAADIMNEKGVPAAMLHFSEIWPLPELKLPCTLNSIKKIVAVEGNATAQFASLFSAHTGVKIKEKVLRYDGRPLTAEYIIKKL
ncbi:MAG: 2-oxoacid:acceptor oxidoreductase subunit alpha [Candidatus Firestonebacteria bacterium]